MATHGKKKCDGCGRKTKATWRARGKFYCYHCYQKEIIFKNAKTKT